MIIQNKRTGQRHSLTRQQYENLKAAGFAGSWTIISNKDEDQDTTPKRSLPKDIIDFSQITKKKPRKK